MKLCHSHRTSALACIHQPLRVMAALLSFVVTFQVFAQLTTYIVVRLPNNVSIELPRNWVAFSNNQRITLDATVIAREQNTGSADFQHDLAFVASYYDEDAKTAGIVNVRYYPKQTITQSDVRLFSRDEIQDIDRVLKEEIQKGLAISDRQLLAWLGTSRQTINGTIALVSEYRRSSPNGSFRVKLVRVLDASRSGTLTVSFREDQAYFLQPISEYIVRSLRR